jgi:hypothetical protein
MSASKRSGGTLARMAALGLVADRRRTALLGEQVDRQRRVARRREAARDHADVVGEAAVLVDHQHAAHRIGRGGERGHQRAARSWERDRLRGDGRPFLDRPVGVRSSAAIVMRAVRARLGDRAG